MKNSTVYVMQFVGCAGEAIEVHSTFESAYDSAAGMIHFHNLVLETEAPGYMEWSNNFADTAVTIEETTVR